MGRSSTKAPIQEFDKAHKALEWAADFRNGMEFCRITRNALREVVELAVIAAVKGYCSAQDEARFMAKAIAGIEKAKQ